MVDRDSNNKLINKDLPLATPRLPYLATSLIATMYVLFAYAV